MRKDLQTKSTVCTFTVLTLHYNIIHFLCTKIEVCDIQKKKKKNTPQKTKQNKNNPKTYSSFKNKYFHFDARKKVRGSSTVRIKPLFGLIRI